MAMMKSSNTEWLGDIPAEWDVAQIGNYYELRNEKVSDYDFEPLSVTMKGIVTQLATAAKSDDHSNRKLVKKGDFVINSRSDRRGSCGISPLDGSVSLINTVMEPRGEMNPQYYNWLFHTEQFADEFYKWGHGIVNDLWTTRWQEMKKILIVAPSPDEQQAIANYLDETCSKIDEIIAEAKASIDEYKGLKQAVIFEAVTKGLDKNVEMKFVNLEYLDSCPVDWNILPISMLFDFFGGFAYKSDRFCEETNNQVVRLGNVKDDELRLNSNPVYVSDEYANDSSKAAIKVDDILFTMTGTRGKGDYFYTLIIVEDDLKEKDLFLNQRVGCFRKAYHAVYMPYYNYLLKSPKIRERVFLYETGTANQGNIGIENINRIRLYNPPMEVQKNIVRILNQKCSTIDSLIAEKESLINDLEAYKKSLIYEVVTGKRRVV